MKTGLPGLFDVLKDVFGDEETPKTTPPTVSGKDLLKRPKSKLYDNMITQGPDPTPSSEKSKDEE
jgi:hypothetical protein